MLLHAALSGLVFGFYFTLVGLGLNLVFGVMRIVNLAHGDFLMLGAYSAFWLFGLYHLHPLLSAACVLVVFTLVGLPLYYLVVPRLLAARDSEMLSLILFFGLQQMIEAVTSIAFGTTERSIPGRVLGSGPVRLLGQALPTSWVFSAGVSLAAVALVYVYLYQTRLGMLTRAVMVSREEAVATGIDLHRVCAIAFGLGLGLAGIAGVFAPFMLGSVTPAIGPEINIAAFAVIVVGTLGNPLGTVLGGIVYGVSLMLMQTYLSSWANLLPNLLLIAVLLVRPTGLLGRRVRRA
ncbi:MAG: branched-chain amino acid ABC transporter permease [Acidisphaera sp.]|nr:branched-chain amino acid ABC transporter permease [Acidisphaera sp.]